MTVQATVDALWRLESARIVAVLSRLVRDVGLAEELAQDAVVAALTEWPVKGVPVNPGGWLMTTARHRAIDRLRRDDRLAANIAELGRAVEHHQEEQEEQDDVLRLIFIACHPVLPAEARVALTLKVVGGLTTEEIARAFVVPVPTVAQRIVRAKRTLADKHIPFELPPAEELAGRLASVLEVVYLIFNEGYTATAGDEWLRPELTYEALRLGRMLAELAPDEPEVHGLAALMELQSSRNAARLTPEGDPVPLLEQNRGRWDRLLIRRGYTALLRAQHLKKPAGPYVLQAAIAACHARAFRPEDTDWPAIAALYASLHRLTSSPVVQLNREVAVAMAEGPETALEMVDEIAGDPALRGYHLLPSVRGDLLARLGRVDEARAEFERAAALTGNRRERDALLSRTEI
ncbi:RNA polymerase sigma factor [Actinoplanes bogorensis]|uniref:RNA polymerase sigma factor n=1 Tax=Paractinoplanes bogorensis TaxID=1610840 RepID=A0ABS5Z1G6_9ACTN|nr:RNA polymerase sigma factor [Actinoplanes bogorensis]MBU2669497.1 RNA polymerase sigma factor [Actinoplanes bogorensis]